HFRPEFINRIDEIIVFHSLNQSEIRQIVELQLNRVKRTALGQGVELEFDVSVVDHFGAVGFRPEFGARELRRLIRSELETELAREMLSGRIEDGDKVRVAWSEDEQRVVFEKIVKDTGDDSPDDQAKAGIEEPSEVAENKTDVPKPSVGDEVQSKDDKSAE
ncbi:ATPase, partial [Haematobacter missouriensis]